MFIGLLAVKPEDDMALPYSVYRSRITQQNTDPPTGDLIENTLSGTPVLSRPGVGESDFTLAGAFPDPSKIYSPNIVVDAANSVFGIWTWVNSNIMRLTVYRSGAEEDFWLTNTPIEILVYP